MLPLLAAKCCGNLDWSGQSRTFGSWSTAFAAARRVTEDSGTVNVTTSFVVQRVVAQWFHDPGGRETMDCASGQGSP